MPMTESSPRDVETALARGEHRAHRHLVRGREERGDLRVGVEQPVRRLAPAVDVEGAVDGPARARPRRTRPRGPPARRRAGPRAGTTSASTPAGPVMWPIRRWPSPSRCSVAQRPAASSSRRTVTWSSRPVPMKARGRSSASSDATSSLLERQPDHEDPVDPAAQHARVDPRPRLVAREVEGVEQRVEAHLAQRALGPVDRVRVEPAVDPRGEQTDGAGAARRPGWRPRATRRSRARRATASIALARRRRHAGQPAERAGDRRRRDAGCSCDVVDAHHSAGARDRRRGAHGTAWSRSLVEDAAQHGDRAVVDDRQRDLVGRRDHRRRRRGPSRRRARPSRASRGRCSPSPDRDGRDRRGPSRACAAARAR